MATSVGARRSNVRNQSSRNIYHLCFNSGTFTPNFSGTVSYLIVAGGGGGGMDMGGGGGGGAVYEGTATVTAGTAYPIVVGAAGQGAPAGGVPANPNYHQFTQSATQGGASSAFGNTCYGGGYGGSSYWNYTPNNGYGQGGGNVGSGGGTSGYGVTDGTTRAGGAAGTGGVGSRNAGGLGRRQSGYFSGGGGGAGAAGQDGISTARPFGGDGFSTSIVEGFTLYFGAGGGGAGYTADGGQGGSGIGGGGALDSECQSSNGLGLANKNGWGSSWLSGSGAEGVSALLGTFGETGGFGRTSTWAGGRGGNAARWSGAGGGGGGHYNRGNNGGDGGSGIVIIKHLRSLGDSSFNPTNSNNISARNDSKFDLNNDIIFNMDAQHEYPYALDHVLLVAGGGAGGLDMGGGGGAGGVVSYINYPVPYFEGGSEEIYFETSIGAGGTGSGTYANNPPPGGNGGDSTFHIKVRNVSTNTYTPHLNNKIVAKGGGGGGSGHYTAAYGDGRGVHGGSAGGDSPKWGGYIKQTEGTLGTPGQGSAGGAAGYNGNGSYESGGGGGSYSAGMPGASADSQQLCGDGGRGFTMPNQLEWGGLSSSFSIAGGGGGGGYDTHGGDGYDGGGGGSSWSKTAGTVIGSNTQYATAASGITGNSSGFGSAGGAATTATQGGNGGAKTGGGGGGGNHQALGGNGGSGLCIIACNYPDTYILGGTGMAFKRNQNNRNQIHSQSSGDVRLGSTSSSTSFHPRDIAGNFTCDATNGSGSVNGYISKASQSDVLNFGGNNAPANTSQLYPHHTVGDADIKYYMDTYSDPNGPNNVPDPSRAWMVGTFFSGQTLGGVNQFDGHRLGPKRETHTNARGWFLNGSVPRFRFMKHPFENVSNPHTSDGVLYGLRERGSYEFWVKPTTTGNFTLAHFGGTSLEYLHMYLQINSSASYIFLTKVGGSSAGNSLSSTTYRVQMSGNVNTNTYGRFSGRNTNNGLYRWHHVVFTFDYERNYTRPSIQPTNGDTQTPSYYTGGWDIYWDGVCMTDPSISALGMFYYILSGADLSSAGVSVTQSTNASYWTGLPLATDFADQYMYIGNLNGGSAIGNGYFSCARIYKRCLERDEVKQLYLSQVPLFVKKESYDDPNSTRIAKEGHITNLW